MQVKAYELSLYSARFELQFEATLTGRRLPSPILAHGTVEHGMLSSDVAIAIDAKSLHEALPWLETTPTSPTLHVHIQLEMDMASKTLIQLASKLRIAETRLQHRNSSLAARFSAIDARMQQSKNKLEFDILAPHILLVDANKTQANFTEVQAIFILI